MRHLLVFALVAFGVVAAPHVARAGALDGLTQPVTQPVTPTVAATTTPVQNAVSTATQVTAPVAAAAAGAAAPVVATAAPVVATAAAPVVAAAAPVVAAAAPVVVVASPVTAAVASLASSPELPAAPVAASVAETGPARPTVAHREPGASEPTASVPAPQPVTATRALPADLPEGRAALPQAVRVGSPRAALPARRGSGASHRHSSSRSAGAPSAVHVATTSSAPTMPVDPRIGGSRGATTSDASSLRSPRRLPLAPRGPQPPLGALTFAGGSAGFTLAAAIVAALISFFCLAHPRTSRRLRLAIDLLVVPPSAVPLEHPG